ncbi:MAG: bifunctional DNA-formamidopyrimidine glycosylase/DNA-(apurinic or apyrimidinic site) lyase, partial [Betaproteobacteria bacterium]
MPELPEVEVTRRQLAPLLVGRIVSDVGTTSPSYFFVTPPSALRRKLRGRRILALDRVGKYLLASLDNGDRLLLHLGMTGQLFGAGATSVRLLSSTAGAALAPEQQLAAFRPDAHTHLRLRFRDGGPAVFFRDVRKFGKVELLPGGRPSARLERLGPDALRARGDVLHAATRRRQAPVKAVLLDQSVLAGVGNIYADEALFLACIRPTRPAHRLSRAEWRALAAAVRRVLRRSIATGGSSISDYVRPDGSDGAYQDERRAYGRTGEPCRRCRTSIR